MSKKPRKTASRATSRAALRKPSSAAAKRPAAASKRGADERIARALEAIVAHLSAASAAPELRDPFDSADAFVWHPNGRLAPVPRVSRVDLGLLKGIDRMRDILIENTERFSDGLPANNALLWGARGMGKSSLVKAAHASINAGRKPADSLAWAGAADQLPVETLEERFGEGSRLAAPSPISLVKGLEPIEEGERFLSCLRDIEG